MHPIWVIQVYQAQCFAVIKDSGKNQLLDFFRLFKLYCGPSTAYSNAALICFSLLEATEEAPTKKTTIQSL